MINLYHHRTISCRSVLQVIDLPIGKFLVNDTDNLAATDHDVEGVQPQCVKTGASHDPSSLATISVIASQ